jgi:hypothetical protein
MQNRYALVFAALAGVASLAACQDKPQDVAELPSVPSAFPELLFPPGGMLRARAGSEDALQLIFDAPGDPAQIADEYRARLTRPRWRIISDDVTGGVTTIYAESNGRPVWIRIMESPGVGTRVELNGAVLARDSAAALDSAIARDSAAATPAAAADSTPR